VTHLRAIVSACLLAAVLATAAPAGAKLSVGISEQSSEMFTNKYFKPLKIRKARLVVPWNVLSRKDYWPAYLDAWLAGAKANGVEPHIAWNIADFSASKRGKGPKPARLQRITKAFRKKYPQVKVFTPWNEVNHAFQPTARKPKLAYQYYRAVKKACPKCKVLAADVLDDSSMVSWVRKFKRYYKGRGIWGIHNYGDANKHRSLKASFTYKLARMVKGKIWSTEAGGIVGFKTIKGRVGYKYSTARQVKAQNYLFKLMRNRKVRKRYDRVYIYNYFGTWSKAGKKTNRWDSGLLNLDGTPRPAYRALKRSIKKLR
jgi:hypothetical protein